MLFFQYTSAIASTIAAGQHELQRLQLTPIQSMLWLYFLSFNGAQIDSINRSIHFGKPHTSQRKLSQTNGFTYSSSTDQSWFVPDIYTGYLFSFNHSILKQSQRLFLTILQYVPPTPLKLTPWMKFCNMVLLQRSIIND